MPYYAVAKGRVPGIYQTWSACQREVHGFSKPVFKKFNTEAEAKQFIISKLTNIDQSDHTEYNNEQQPESSFSEEMIEKLENNILKNADTEEHKSRKRNAISAFAIPSENKKLKTLVLDQMNFLVDDDGFVHVYTDGSCENNGKKSAVAGLGVYWGNDHKLNTAQPVRDRPTNNCGEIQAATLAIKLAQKHRIEKLCINTDSKFTIQAVNDWMPGWKRNNWQLSNGKPVKNQKDFMELEKQLDSSQIHIKWVSTIQIECVH